MGFVVDLGMAFMDKWVVGNENGLYWLSNDGVEQLAKKEDQTVKSTKTDGLFIHSERAEERERAAYWELKG